MSRSRTNLDRFVGAVHRRWVMLRMVETTGLAVLGGCGMSLLVLPILLWRREPALPVVLTTTAVAAFAGFIAGVVRRPSLLSAATEADRQLQLADLLSTALLTHARSPADPWAMTVVATADERCRTLAPNTVLLNRLGARAWGGVGLAMALVLTLGLMSSNPQHSAALATAGADYSIAPDAGQFQTPLSAARDRAEPAQRQRDPHNGSEAVAADSTTTEAATARATDRASRSAASATESGGAGLATSPQESAPRRPAQLASPTASPTNPNGVRAAGGTSTVSADPTDDDALASVVASRGAQSTPPWASPGWPAAREQALSAVRDHRVPDRYRDLVREYFNEKPD
ncbi:MAG TPA: hypothetical protein VGR35_18705 [Tepidisphaeraceae bacterium]|nr:hypothetical protein [Tepidisphaeraceae bacterium]